MLQRFLKRSTCIKSKGNSYGNLFPFPHFCNENCEQWSTLVHHEKMKVFSMLLLCLCLALAVGYGATLRYKRFSGWFGRPIKSPCRPGYTFSRGRCGYIGSKRGQITQVGCQDGYVWRRGQCREIIKRDAGGVFRDSCKYGHELLAGDC